MASARRRPDSPGMLIVPIRLRAPARSHPSNARVKAFRFGSISTGARVRRDPGRRAQR